MKKIPLSQQGKNAGKYFALVDDEDYERVIKFKWHRKLDGNNIYARRNIIISGKQKHEILHRFILNANHNQIIDHIDGNGLNNQKNNLRYVTYSQNQMNKKTRKNELGFKGVYFRPALNLWLVKLGINKEEICLGHYKTKIEAAKAYNKKAIELFGEFARLNIIPGENAN